MAFQTPRIYSRHILRAAGSGNITSSAVAAGFPLARLLDDQTKRLFKFNAAAANQHVTVDQTAAPLECDNLTIPAGHNLGGATLEVRSSADPASWPGTLRATKTVSAGSALIWRDFSAFTADHIRVQIVTSGQWQFGELVLSNLNAFTLGPKPRFVDSIVSNFGQARMLSGEVFRNIRGSAQRVIEIEWTRLDSTVQADIDAIASDTQNGVLPIYIGSPYDDKVRLPVRIVEGLIRREQDSPNPAGIGIEETLILRMREALE